MYFYPLIPVGEKGQIKTDILKKAQNLCIGSAKLSSLCNEQFSQSLEKLWLICDSYYMNGLENQDIKIEYIYSATNSHFDSNAKIKNLQSLSLSFMETKKYFRTHASFYDNPYAKELISDIHERFYFANNMESFLKLSSKGKTYTMQPGVIREMDVMRRGEQSLEASLLNAVLHYFEDSYFPSLKEDIATRLIYAICAYHRLLWMHPFLFANERIANMFLDFLFSYIRVDGGGLWSLARGIKRHKKEYMEALLKADKKSNVYGRGELCEKGLEEFVCFMLDVCNEEIEFGLKNFPKIPQRLHNYVKLSQSGFFDQDPLPKHSELLFEKLLVYGEFPRGEIKNLIGKQDRASTYFTKRLSELGFIYSDTPRGNLKMNFNLHLASKLFPELLD